MPKDSRPYLDPYLRAADKFGPGFDALLWQSPKAQKIRFRVISKLLDTTGRTVADIGCGNADLLRDLHERNHAPARYIGIDAVPKTLDHARSQTRAAGIDAAVFLDHDFVRETDLAEQLVRDAGADTIIFCGSLNTLLEHDAQSILDRFWKAVARRENGALVFNFLSDRHDRARTPANPPAVRFDPVNMVHWALDRTPLVTFRHDYLGGHDATICMKSAAPS